MTPDQLYRQRDRDTIKELLEIFPITAILGPRQVGKTTIAKTFNPDHLFDLENPRDFELMQNPQIALENLKGLIMIDEIQRKPEIFSLLRYLVDNRPNQKYLILGSASSNLRQQSGESLAGRIGYYYLTGFNLTETGPQAINDLWLRGGFPRSFLSKTEAASISWRSNFISTFLEKDLALLGIKIPVSTMFRFWIMVSHYHGQVLNLSELGRSFGITDKTIKSYISILEDTFMLRVLMPWHANVGKRLVKSPKLYIRDSGIFHSLQSIQSMSDLSTNPKLGASWEGFAMEELISLLGKRDNELFFYGSHSGQELDLLWQESGKNFGAEFKYLDAPKMTKSMHQSIEDLKLEKLWVIYPGDKLYQLSEKTIVIPVTNLNWIKNNE